MARMDAPSKVSMKGIGVSSKWSYQRPKMTEQIPKTRFGGQFRTQALTVGPRLIGASPVWQPAAPIGAAEATRLGLSPSDFA